MIWSVLIALGAPEDVDFLRVALQSNGVTNAVRAVASSEEASQYLRGEGKFAERNTWPIPGVAILDADMPGALEFLEWKQWQPEFDSMACVAAVRRGDYNAIRKAYDSGAKWCLAKPLEWEEIEKFITTFQMYWLKSK